jgi:hypothetical protein
MKVALETERGIKITCATLPFPGLFSVTLRFRFFSSNPLPNILKSDLSVFVEAKKGAKINFDNRGRFRMPLSLLSSDCSWNGSIGFVSPEESLVCSNVYVRGKANSPSGGSVRRSPVRSLLCW